MRKNFILLFLIVLLGAILRFWQLGDIPVGLHRDEAFLGYNAYSLMQTGKDMTGVFLPLHFESFIYSPGGYSYLSIPFIKLFDLSAFSVRFASALFGSLTVLFTYFLVRELFGKKWEVGSEKVDNDMRSGKRNLTSHLTNPASHLALRTSNIALLTSFLLAISPWHINLSRTATENIVVAFFITLSVWLFFLWRRKRMVYFLIASFISFGLTLFIYQAPRALLPLFIPFLLLLFFEQKIQRKNIFFPIALFLITIIFPLMFIITSKDLSLRIRTVSIFEAPETQLTLDESIREDGVREIPSTFSRIYHNKIIGYSSQFVQNYFSHFTFDFLFTDQGYPIRYKIPNASLLYLFELPLLLVGLWMLFKKRDKTGIFLIGWILLVPIGSAFASDDVPNLQRTVIVFPALSIISAVGLYRIILFVQKEKFRFLYTIVIGVISIYSISSYLHQYYIHQVVHQPWYRHEGYEELVRKVNNLLPNYEKAIVTDRESAPTIFFLFYGKYDPLLFQIETKDSTLRDFDRVSFEKYEFSQEECPLKDPKQGEESIRESEKDTLYVNYSICKTPKNFGRLIDTVSRSDQTNIFQILEVKE